LLVNQAVPKDLTITEITEATQADSTIQKVISNNKATKWTKEQETAPYYPKRLTNRHANNTL